MTFYLYYDYICLGMAKPIVQSYNAFIAFLGVIIIVIVFSAPYYLEYSKKYINVNDKTRTREEIIDDIIRHGCMNGDECDAFLKKYREDKVRKSWAE